MDQIFQILTNAQCSSNTLTDILPLTMEAGSCLIAYQRTVCLAFNMLMHFEERDEKVAPNSHVCLVNMKQ